MIDICMNVKQVRTVASFIANIYGKWLATCDMVTDVCTEGFWCYIFHSVDCSDKGVIEKSICIHE